jgi:gamma-glutamyltranspeptidase/glutathione hydrolase
MSKVRGIVVCPQPLAAHAGAEALRAGGNAIDAALAAAFVQGVVDPHMAGIGGFGCLLAYNGKSREVTTIAFHGRAGSAARPDTFAKRVHGRVPGHGERYVVDGMANQIGYESVVVPGVVAGFAETHSRFGKLAWAKIIEPAERIAREGFRIGGDLYRNWTRPESPGHADSLTRFRASQSSAKIFLKNGELMKAGELLVQEDYACTLRALANDGPDAFYRGAIAKKIAEDFAKNGGLFSYDDLASYKPDLSPPVRGRYRGNDIVSMPAPASGPQIIQILNMLEHYDLGAMERDTADYIALVSDVMQLSFDDRRRYLGDPAFVDVPSQRLMDLEFAIERLRELPRLTHEGPELELSLESADTTHVCTADADGNAVSLTHTIGSASGVVVDGLGFTMNNCMYQFTPIPDKANSIAPGKARITGVSPTIVLRDDRPVLICGAPGGTHILGANVHTILNVVDFKLSALEAVSVPRFHAENGYIELEPSLYFETHAELERRGYPVEALSFVHDRSLAAAHAIVWPQPPQRASMEGGADPRAGGAVARVL